eukprot:939103-Lingulodinium_polyedra.AAC.1
MGKRGVRNMLRMHVSGVAVERVGSKLLEERVWDTGPRRLRAGARYCQKLNFMPRSGLRPVA